MSIRIITDSACDLPQEIIEKNDIGVAPLHVLIDGVDYVDGIELSHEDYYRKVEASGNLPKTSQPAPGDVIQLIEDSLKRYKQVISVNLSSGVSGTYQTVNMVKENFGDVLHIVDSKNGSIGIGMQVLKAVELAKKELSPSEIVKQLNEYRQGLDVLVYLETLENAVKGGRISSLQYMAASLLNVKPVVYMSKEDGLVRVLEKIRGEKKAWKYMINAIKSKNVDYSERTIGVTHADCLEKAKEFVQMLKEEINPKEILFHTMGPVIGTYAAKGAIYVCF